MPIRPHAQSDYVKAGDLRPFQAKTLPDIEFIFRRSFFRVEFAVDAKDLSVAQGYFVEQRLSCHAVVAVRLVGRHTAFVDPVELQLAPGNLCAVGGAGIAQELKHMPRCVASGDCDSRLASCPSRRNNMLDQILRRAPAYFLRTLVHVIENF